MNVLFCSMIGGFAFSAIQSSPEVQDSSPTDASVAAEVDELAHAKLLYRQGKAKFETMDYLGAIDLWTAAYSEIPSTPEYSDIQARFLYNIARGRMRAHAMDGDILHLKQAKGLLERYLQTLDETSQEETHTSSEVQQVKDILAQVTADLQAVETAAKEAEKKNATPPPLVQPIKPMDDPRERKQGRDLLISGGVLLGSSVGLFAGMAVGFIQGKKAEQDGKKFDLSVPASELTDIHQRGQAANTLALATGISGGILAASGIVLMAIGGKKLNKSKHPVNVAFRPGGVWLMGQF